MLGDKIFIIKLVPIYGNTSASIALQKVTGLNHEILNNPMELAPLIPNGKTSFSVLPGAELPEVFSSFGGDVGEELHLDTTGGDGADGDVEEDDRILRVRRPQVPPED